MKRKLGLVLSLVIALTFCTQPLFETAGYSSTAYAAQTVDAPKAKGAGKAITSEGSYNAVLSCATAGAKIYYSTGGEYKQYTKPVKIEKNTTIKCYAEKNGTKSKTVTFKYKLKPKVTVNIPNGRYYKAQSVKLASPVSGVKYYYTLDGSLPTKDSAKYSKAIKITESCTLRVLVKKSGWSSYYITRNYTVAAKDASLLSDYEGKYYYNTLSYSEKQLYKCIYDAASSFQNELSVNDSDCDDVEKIFPMVKRDNPQFFWLNNVYGSYSLSGDTYLIYPDYSMTKKEALAMQKKLDAVAEPIIKKALQESDMKERARVLHDALINISSYSDAPWERSNGEADGPLVNKTGRCEGYAKAFAYLAQSAGIDTICITGMASSLPHMWNMIKLDGKWYHVDPTFDDPSGGVPTLSYEYFCVDDDYIGGDHLPYTDIQTPSAIKYDPDAAKKDFDKFMTEIKKNYDKGILTTRYYSDVKPFSSFLIYTTSNMNDGVREKGINMRPWYKYYSNWIEIELRPY